MTTSTKLGIPYIASQQSTPEITHNEALYMLEALLRGVIDRTNTPPGSPTDGDSYLITSVATGAWAGWENHIAIRAGNAWRFVPGYDTGGTPIPIGAAHEGMRVYVIDEDAFYQWSGAAWVSQGTGPFVAKAGDTMTGRLNFDSATELFPILAICTSAGAQGPGAAFRHLSASPAVADVVSSQLFQGLDDAAAVRNVAGYSAIVDNVTAAGFSGRYQYNTMQAGTYSSRMQIGAGVWLGGATGTDKGAGNLNVNELYGNNQLCVTSNGIIRSRTYTVATLPAAGNQGRRAMVSDANAPAFGAAVAGGGAAIVPVYDTGAAWNVG